MTRILLAACVLWPALASAQVSPFPGVTPPIFGYPAINGGSWSPASLSVLPSNCPTPAINEQGAESTGIAFTNAPLIRNCVAGNTITTATSTSWTSTVPVLLPDGLVGSAALTFASDTNLDTGVFWVAQNRFQLTAAGAGVAEITASGGGLVLLNSQPLSFSPNTSGGSFDVSLTRLAADAMAPAAGDAFGLDSKALIRTDPTIASGFCTSPSIPVANGTAAFTLTIGTACGASTGTLTMPAATTGWVCDFVNVTTPASNVPSQTGGNTTSVTVTNYARTTGLAANWTDSEVLRGKCLAY